MTLNWPGSSTALCRCAVSGMALTPSSQQLMSPFHRNHVTIPSSACRTLVLSSILGRTSGKGNANTLQGLVTVISHPYTATLRSSLRLRFRTLVMPVSSLLFVFSVSELQFILSFEGFRHSAANKIPHLQHLAAPPSDCPSAGWPFGVICEPRRFGCSMLLGLLRVGRIGNRHDQDSRQRANHSPLVHASRALRC